LPNGRRPHKANARAASRIIRIPVPVHHSRTDEWAYPPARIQRRAARCLVIGLWLTLAVPWIWEVTIATTR
jgi:hypothetical protein